MAIRSAAQVQLAPGGTKTLLVQQSCARHSAGTASLPPAKDILLLAYYILFWNREGHPLPLDEHWKQQSWQSISSAAHPEQNGWTESCYARRKEPYCAHVTDTAPSAHIPSLPLRLEVPWSHQVALLSHSRQLAVTVLQSSTGHSSHSYPVPYPQCETQGKQEPGCLKAALSSPCPTVSQGGKKQPQQATCVCCWVLHLH